MTSTVVNIAATTHGRYLVRNGRAERLLVGFHGYAESAEIQMERLAMIPGAGNWTLVSIQGMHRFYRRRSDAVVASWMTRQDRELMIRDNVAYVGAVVDTLLAAGLPDPTLVFAGFSQGVSMAFRAACLGSRSPSAVVAFGGDVPPELTGEELRRAGRVLIGRGRQDPVYPDLLMTRDVDRFKAAGGAVEIATVEAGHEWTASFADLAARFLAALP